jgi:hypothetical protein
VLEWSLGEIVSIFKNIILKIVPEEFPQEKKKLWGGHLLDVFPKSQAEEIFDICVSKPDDISGS